MRKTLAITKALSDGSRLRILNALMGVDELCVCQITEMLGFSTATVSRHMSLLQGADIVDSRKDGRWVYYRISENFPPILQKWLKDSMGNSNEIKNDEKKLKVILACDPRELCKPN